MFPAREFMNQHCSRIKLSSDYVWNLGYEEPTGVERPEEHAAFMKDMRRQISDVEYRRDRQMGMPSQYLPPSLQKALELQRQEQRQIENTTTEQPGDRAGGPVQLQVGDRRGVGKVAPSRTPEHSQVR